MILEAAAFHTGYIPKNTRTKDAKRKFTITEFVEKIIERSL
jgi:hypothetical protein